MGAMKRLTWLLLVGVLLKLSMGPAMALPLMGVMISLAPGQRGELVVHFAEATRLQIACLVPGHYEAGMRGSLTVLPAAQAKPGKAPAAKHDHSSHQH
jgi:hypothetical protein